MRVNIFKCFNFDILKLKFNIIKLKHSLLRLFEILVLIPKFSNYFFKKYHK